MPRKTIFVTSALIVMSLLISCDIARSESGVCRLDGIARVKQMHNYCGPACMESVLRYFGKDINQAEIGKDVYDKSQAGTNGGDMVHYARKMGLSAYSWNSTLSDLKSKIDAGIPVIVLQQNSASDTSGHYRVLTGYDDHAKKCYVMDPYYDDVTEMDYDQFDRFWRRMDRWALVIVPREKDIFSKELGALNPVVHLDLSYAQYRRGDYVAAMSEAKQALALQPRNGYARSLMLRIKDALRAKGAGR